MQKIENKNWNVSNLRSDPCNEILIPTSTNMVSISAWSRNKFCFPPLQYPVGVDLPPHLTPGCHILLPFECGDHGCSWNNRRRPVGWSVQPETEIDSYNLRSSNCRLCWMLKCPLMSAGCTKHIGQGECDIWVWLMYGVSLGWMHVLFGVNDVWIIYNIKISVRSIEVRWIVVLRLLNS